MNEAQLLDLGKISWLWSSSKLHRGWNIRLFADFAIPAIEKSQYMILESKGAPVAYCSWAFLTESSEAEYLVHPSTLPLDRWQSGNRLWFIDWISPFSSIYTWRLQRKLARKFPNRVARAVRVKPGEDKGRVAFFPGYGMERSVSRSIRRQYLLDLKKNVEKLADKSPDFEVTFETNSHAK